MVLRSNPAPHNFTRSASLFAQKPEIVLSVSNHFRRVGSTRTPR